MLLATRRVYPFHLPGAAARGIISARPLHRRPAMTLRNLTLLAVALLVAPSAARADDWPQWMGEKRDNTWRETGVVEKFPAGGPKVVWRTPIAGGYAGPAVS